MKISCILAMSSLLSVSSVAAISAPLVIECSIGDKFSSSGLVVVFTVDLENRFIAYGTGSQFGVPIVEFSNNFIIAHSFEWQSGRPKTTTIILDIENQKMRSVSIGTGVDGDYASSNERECR